MSSRLFQEVREKRGLAYSVFSYRSAFEETGSLAVYCATAPERVEETLDVVRAELDKLVADGGVTERELAGAKGHLTGSLALSLESSSSRMNRMGRAELTMGEIPSLDWVVEQVDAVGPDDVSRVIDRVLGGPERTLALVGPPDTLQ
jgi:predicted Zn-dependent peptidase